MVVPRLRVGDWREGRLSSIVSANLQRSVRYAIPSCACSGSIVSGVSSTSAMFVDMRYSVFDVVELEIRIDAFVHGPKVISATVLCTLSRGSFDFTSTSEQ